jgi:hypothetical protein
VCVCMCVCGIICGDYYNIPFPEKNRSLLNLLFPFLIEKTEIKIETNGHENVQKNRTFVSECK